MVAVQGIARLSLGDHAIGLCGAARGAYGVRVVVSNRTEARMRSDTGGYSR